MKIQARLNSHLAAIIKYIQPSQVVIFGREIANSTMGTKFDFFGSLGETDGLFQPLKISLQIFLRNATTWKAKS